MVGTGVYGIPEAALLARVNTRTAGRWISGADRASRRLLQPDFPSINRRYALSFLDLIDLLVVGRFREEGVSLQMVRRVYERLGETFQTPHPFSHRRLLTDGRTIFLETIDAIGDKQLEEALGGQKAMPEVLQPYLRQIEYADDTQVAERWNIAEGIVIDPGRSFGKPVVAAAGTTTYILARSYWANGEDAELVADLFEVAPPAVAQAVAFESNLAARPAA